METRRGAGFLVVFFFLGGGALHHGGDFWGGGMGTGGRGGRGGLLLRSLPCVMHLPSGWQQAWSGVRWSEHGLSGAVT